MPRYEIHNQMFEIRRYYNYARVVLYYSFEKTFSKISIHGEGRNVWVEVVSSHEWTRNATRCGASIDTHVSWICICIYKRLNKD